MKPKSDQAAQLAIQPCPCGHDLPYARCCGRWHAGEAAPNAELLMRSRYTAYALGLEDYLLRSWHPATRPSILNLEQDQAIKWLGLKIVRLAQLSSDEAEVEFIACYKVQGKAEKLHELSRFVRETGHWLYVDGQFRDNQSQDGQSQDGQLSDKQPLAD